MLGRFALRFGLLAFALYHVPLVLNAFPTLGGGGFREDGLAIAWGHVFGRVGIAVARHVFGIERDLSEGLTGDNGDTVEEFCRLLVAIVVALIAAAVWTAADRRHPRAAWVGAWLRIVLRYSIILGLASYAIAKIYVVQFPALDAPQLEQRLGEMPPMRLLWATMQYARPYALFAGLAELLVVILLCFRRTALLGALICVPVMTNVVLMNWCYGVPVKLFSTMIMLSAVVLVALDGRRLLDVLVLHRSSEAPPIALPFRSPRLNRYRWVVKTLVIGLVMASSIHAMSDAVDERAGGPTRSVLAGTWIVETPGTPWRRLAIGRRTTALRLADDRLVQCRTQVDEAAHALSIKCRDHAAELQWTLTGDVLAVHGTVDQAPLEATLRRQDDAELPLLRTPFYWTYD
jgi:hypothetical protein